MKKYNQIISILFFGLILSTPYITHAAEFAGIMGIIVSVGSIVKMLIVLSAGVALLGFFYGLAMTIFKAGDPKGVEEGKSIMKWGLLALFVMVSVWGIIGFFQSQLGLPNTTGSTPTSLPYNTPTNGGCPAGLC